jgi:pilus assembly protein CpaB
MRSKIVIIILALVLGGFAAVMAATYLRSARQDIAAENQPVEVLVAQENIPRGLSGEELVRRKLVAMEKVPRQFVSVDAVSSTRGIENQVLAVPVATGEQLTRARFQYPAQAGLAYSVPEEFVAIACAVDEVSGVAGLVKPSDYVMVLATLKGDPAKKTETKTLAVIPRARVLAVGTSVGTEPEPEAEEQAGAGALSADRQARGDAPTTVTLALTPADAARLVFAQETGEIRLALLPADGSKLAAPAPVSLGAVSR